MRILLASSEVFPYSKTGGLADMVGALAKFMARAGHQVDVVTPLYRGVRERFRQIQPLGLTLHLTLGNADYSGSIWWTELPEGQRIFFVDQPEFYNRPKIYGEGDHEYPDNPRRFTFLSRAVVYLARHILDPVDLVHTHDWHVGLVPLLIRHEARVDGWVDAPRTCVTIHNLAYQGDYEPHQYSLANLPWDYFTVDGAEFHGRFNFLKAAIAFADAITTVSPSYALEIQTPQFGCGLDGLLRARADVLAGILNGVDYDEWRTENNPLLAQSYSVEDLRGKAVNKAKLQAEFGLPERPEVPLFGTVSRLVHQKGIDIELGALAEELAGDVQFVLLGSGLSEFEDGFEELQGRYPDKVGLFLGYDHGLSHRVEAGTDFYLMPSLFEPCGLNQLYSLRYATLPIVRATGGLNDSVTDVREDVEQANGIKFHEYSAAALAKAMRKALSLYREPEVLRRFQLNGMVKDFSWAKTAEEYLQVYTRALAP